MPEYRIGKRRSRHDHKTSVVIHISVPRRIHDRLCSMRDALQKELGPDIPISIACVARRILYAHAALRKIAHRHYEPPDIDDDGNSLVR